MLPKCNHCTNESKLEPQNLLKFCPKFSRTFLRHNHILLILGTSFVDHLHENLEYEPGELGSEEVKINVEFCGVCHSYLSVLDNDGQMAQYPLVPGHEVVGTIAAV